MSARESRLNGRDEEGFALDLVFQEQLAYDRRLRCAVAFAKEHGLKQAARRFRLAVNTIRNAEAEA